jgi:hypothetical protein
MNEPREPDQQFHHNLRTLGRRIDVPAGPSPDLLSRCQAALESTDQPTQRRLFAMMTKPSVISGLALAASIALVAVLLFPWSDGPKAEAAMIMQKLNQQMEQDPLIEVQLNSVQIEEAFIDGHVYVSRQALAADIVAKVNEDKFDAPIELNVAMALHPNGGWVLIRKLVVPEPQVQSILNLFLLPDGQTLIWLPADMDGGDLDLDLDLDIDEGLGDLQSGRLVEVLKRLIDSHAEYGATIEYQPDGTILLTVPIENAEALAALAELAQDDQPRSATQNRITIQAQRIEINAAERDEDVDIEADSDLIGCTLAVVYDPVAEVVRSFSIYNLGSAGGSIIVNIGQGEIDPALLDPTPLMTPDTKTLDLRALESLFQNIDVSAKTD